MNSKCVYVCVHIYKFNYSFQSQKLYNLLWAFENAHLYLAQYTWFQD